MLMKGFKLGNKEKKSKSGGWGNPDVLDVNLIKDEIGVSFDWKKFSLKLLILGVLSAAFIVQICLALGDWQKGEEKKATELNSGFRQVSQELREMKDQSDTIEVFQEKLELSTELMAKHIYWTNFFNWIEKRTLSSVEYDSFEGDIYGKYSLSAGTANYADISWQVKSFLDDPYTVAARVDSGSSGDSGSDETAVASPQDDEESETGQPVAGETQSGDDKPVSFDIELEVNPEVFYKH